MLRTKRNALQVTRAGRLPLADPESEDLPERLRPGGIRRQSAVLILQLLQPPSPAHLHAAVLALPGVDRRRADALLPRDFLHRPAYFDLLQHADDLLFP